MTIYKEYFTKSNKTKSKSNTINNVDLLTGYEDLANASSLLKTTNYSMNIYNTLKNEKINNITYLQNLNKLGININNISGYEGEIYLDKILKGILNSVVSVWKSILNFIKKIGNWILNLFKSKKTIPEKQKEELTKIMGLLEHKEMPVKGLPDKGFTDDEVLDIAKNIAILKFVYGNIDYNTIINNLEDIRAYINYVNTMFGLTKNFLQNSNKINIEASIDFIKGLFSDISALGDNLRDVKAKDMLRSNTPELFNGEALLVDIDEYITPKQITQHYLYIKTDIANTINNKIKNAKSEADWISIYKILNSSIYTRKNTIRSTDIYKSAIGDISPLPIDQIYAINEKYREVGTKAYKLLDVIKTDTKNTYNALSKLYNTKTKDKLEKLVLQYEIKTVLNIKATQQTNIVSAIKELATPAISKYVQYNLLLFKGMLYDETDNPYLKN